MTTLLFSHPEHAQVTFDAMLATPEMAVAKKFEAATVSGATDCILSPAMYNYLERGADVRAYAIRIASHVIPLAVPVKRERLQPLYRKLIASGVDSSTVLSWFEGEPKSVEELLTIVESATA